MARLIARLARTGLRRGLLEGSQAWLVVGISASTLHVARRILREKEERASVELGLGEGVEVRVVPPPSR